MTKHEEGMNKMQQLRSLIGRLEKGSYDKESLLELARITHWILERWCREHDGRAK